jgi:hypothetical protein
MDSVVCARVGPEAKKLLEQLVVRSGWSSSNVVRQALRLFAGTRSGSGVRKIAGVGKFCSGIPDLGSNKKHLAGFGR